MNNKKSTVHEAIKILAEAVNKAQDHLWILDYQAAYQRLRQALTQVAEILEVKEKQLTRMKLNDIEQLLQEIRAESRTEVEALKWTLIRATRMSRELEPLREINPATDLGSIRCIYECYEDLNRCETKCLMNKTLTIPEEPPKELEYKIKEALRKELEKFLKEKIPYINVHLAPKHSINIVAWTSLLKYDTTILYNKMISEASGPNIPDEYLELAIVLSLNRKTIEILQELGLLE